MIKFNDILDGKYDANEITKKRSTLICELIDKFGGLNIEKEEQIVKSKQFISELDSILNINCV